MNLAKMAVLVASVLFPACATAQKSVPVSNPETPERFMRRVLQVAASGIPGNEILDGSETVYTLGFLDAIYGKGCFTEHRPCVVDHLTWAKICGCRYFPEDGKKKGDPLCGCPGGLKVSQLSVARANTDSADVSALLNLEPHGKDKVTWHLLMTPKGWRVDDVATSDFPSLRAEMSH